MIATKIRNRVYQIPQARPNSVDLRETRSGSRVGFRRIAKPAETLGEFRYVKSMPFRANPAAQRGSLRILLVAKNRNFRRVNLRDSLGHETRVVVIGENCRKTN